MPVFTAVAKIFCLEADCDRNTVILLLACQVLFDLQANDDLVWYRQHQRPIRPQGGLCLLCW